MEELVWQSVRPEVITLKDLNKTNYYSEERKYIVCSIQLLDNIQSKLVQVLSHYLSQFWYSFSLSIISPFFYHFSLFNTPSSSPHFLSLSFVLTISFHLLFVTLSSVLFTVHFLLSLSSATLPQKHSLLASISVLSLSYFLWIITHITPPSTDKPCFHLWHTFSSPSVLY